MSSLTPKTYVMSLSAQEIEQRLLSIDSLLPNSVIKQDLVSPLPTTIPSTQAIVNALQPLQESLGGLGDLATRDSVSLNSTETDGILPVAKGGTGAGSVSAAQSNLGILTQTEIQTLIDNSIPSIQQVWLDSDQINGILPISKGGSGANTPQAALMNLGIHDSTGKVPVSQLPAVALTDTFVEVSQSAMLSLTAQAGDVCIRTDIDKTFILMQEPASTLSNWKELLNDAVVRLSPQIFQSLKRSYAIYGFNLVEGSFETGGTLQAEEDVLVLESSGRVYSWSGVFPKVVSPGTNPTSDPSWELLVENNPISEDPVLDVKWLTIRTPMRTGYTAGDGQTLPRALYPDAFAAIQAGLVPVCTDAEWVADPSKRGCFTLGDGSTTFRVPDYNGKSEGSLGAAVFRGDGKNAAPAGDVQGDAIRNIEGTWTEFYGGLSNDPSKYSGAFELVSSATGNAGNNLSVTKGITAKFSAARVVPTAEENRMVNVAGCWGIKLFGAVQNAGSADAAALATAVADLAARVSVLETRKYTTLIPATLPAGAPHDTHETVETQLPTTISNDTRYVLPNPFGVNARVQAIAELYVNGKWAEPGWDGNTGTGALAYGVRATYVQGEGIVVQTGATTVIVASKLGGGGHGYSGASLTTAPCRVFVRKLEG